jgi:hypothetical protein
VGAFRNECFRVLVSKKQHMVLNLPRSRARILTVLVSLGSGLGFCDVSALQAQDKITGQSRQILFEGLPPQTQDLHGFFL